MFKTVVPPNTELEDHCITVVGKSHKHINAFLCEYLSYDDGYRITESKKYFKHKAFKHELIIELNARGQPKKPLVCVRGGCASYDSSKVTMLDFDNLEGI